MLVRPATAADADAIARVHVRGWQVAYAHLLPAEFLNALSVDERYERWWRQLAELASDQHVLVAEGEDGVCGFASVGPSRDTDTAAGTGELMALYLDPGRWRRGIGTRLQRQALNALAWDGFRTAILWVLSGNERAVFFYERTGWVPDGHCKDEPQGDVVLREVRYRRTLP